MKPPFSAGSKYCTQRSLASAGLLILGLTTAIFSVTTTTPVRAQASCTVCHKLTTTLTLACGSIEYRRHIDHGDPMGPCRVTETQNP